MTEFIFQRRLKQDKKNKLTWYFPVRKTQKKDSKQERDTMNSKYIDKSRNEDELLRIRNMKQTKIQFDRK